ncbi:hypothetical protein JCM10213_001697 [Rhodosporidiobolus nylandii]
MSTAKKRTALSPKVIQLPHSSATTKLLTRLSQQSLANLALTWLAETPRTHGAREDSDSDDEGYGFDGPSEGRRSRKALYEELSDDEVKGGRTRVVRAVKEDWRDGLTYRQVAQLDMQHFQDKGLGRSWTVYQAALPPAATVASSSQLFERFRNAFGAYHTHYLHLAHLPAPHALTILRIQLLPTPSASSSLPSHPAPIFLLHLPSTPFFLLPSALSSSFRPIILQCLASAVSTPQASALDEIQLKGKDWKGLREVLLRRGSNTGQWRALRDGNKEQDGGGALVPKEKRRRPAPVPEVQRENDRSQLPPTAEERKEGRAKRARRAEVEEVFGEGEGDLPVLERLDYTVDLPYPTHSTFSTPSASHPPILMRFEGAHVLRGLRALVSAGLAEGKADEGTQRAPGLPSWLAEAADMGVNKGRVGRRADGTVGRI